MPGGIERFAIRGDQELYVDYLGGSLPTPIFIIEFFLVRFVWRLCETSQVLKTGTWCSHMDALAWGIGSYDSCLSPLHLLIAFFFFFFLKISLDFGDQVEFTCPPYRDPTEPGGAFAIYVGRFSPLDKNESYVTAAEFLVSGEERRVGNGTLPSRSKKGQIFFFLLFVSFRCLTLRHSQIAAGLHLLQSVQPYLELSSSLSLSPLLSVAKNKDDPDSRQLNK